MRIRIDKKAGFCFGVAASVKMAEEAVVRYGKIMCLGQLMHNEEEIRRLETMGVEFIDYEQYKNLKNERVLLRAHGEAPETYRIAEENNLELIDATCPIVTKLQQKVYCSSEEIAENGGQVVIFGKKEHPEVIGLSGQTNQTAIIVNNESDLNKIDSNKAVHLFTQTTKNKSDFNKLIVALKSRGVDNLTVNNKICSHVANREDSVIDIAKHNDVVIFVAGKNSSNGRTLFSHCLEYNKRAYYVSSMEEIENEWFENANSVGITGGTSTPVWLMYKIANHLEKLFNN